MVVTRHQNQQAVPQDTSVLCPAPQVCGQASHCTKEGVTDRRDLITRLVDWPCQTSKPWGKACLSHGAHPPKIATRFPLFVIPASVRQLVWSRIQQNSWVHCTGAPRHSSLVLMTSLHYLSPQPLCIDLPGLGSSKP